MRVMVWGDSLTRVSLDNAKRIAGRNTVAGAVLKKPIENIAIKGIDIYFVPNDSTILANAVKGNGPILLLPSHYKATPDFLKTVNPLIDEGNELVTWDFDEGYSAAVSARSLFFCLSERGCEALRSNLNNLNYLHNYHVPEHLFCRI